MAHVNDDDQLRPSGNAPLVRPGWTAVHSWLFIIIVAVGFLAVAYQNRYQYLDPGPGGRVFRVSKVFGTIQEFNPAQGWVMAQPAARFPGEPSDTIGRNATAANPFPMNSGTRDDVDVLPATSEPVDAEPDTSGTREPVPMAVRETTMPEGVAPPSPTPTPGAEPTPNPVEALAPDENPPASEPLPAQPAPPVSTITPVEPEPEPVEMTEQERFQAFKEAFPNYGEPEFKLANDDLFPDWKQSGNSDGTWTEFLEVYEQFIQWWLDAGAPPEPGFKLWQDFKQVRNIR